MFAFIGPPSDSFVIILVVIFILGTRQMCKWTKESPLLRTGLKRGGMGLWRLLK